MNHLRRMATSIRTFFTDLITPFATIARELRRMNDLKELELASRINPKTGEPDPVIPVTEYPGRGDTEVFFGEEKDAHGIQKMRDDLARVWAEEE